MKTFSYTLLQYILENIYGDVSVLTMGSVLETYIQKYKKPYFSIAENSPRLYIVKVSAHCTILHAIEIANAYRFQTFIESLQYPIE